MKKLILIILVAAMSSCVKQYQCDCTNGYYKWEYVIDAKKKNAAQIQEFCETMYAEDLTITCTFKKN
jgi:hypothetical protein